MKTNNHSENAQSGNPQPGPHQKRSVLWIGVIFIISGFVFFLGVFVGRGTAPALFDYKKIETEIALLSKTFTDNQKTQNDIETDILATQAELEYPEELKKKSEDSGMMQIPVPEKPIKPAETPKPAHQEPVQEPQPATVKSDFQTAAKPETVEHPPDAIKPEPEVKIKSMYDLKASQARETAPERPVAPPPERASAATPKPQAPVSDTKAATAAQPVAVHLASMVDRKSADALIESLRSKGISATKTPKMIQGKGIWYTVTIGKYASSTEAEAVLNRLRQENVDASLVKP